MRKIKFRGINKETNEWEYGFYGLLENETTTKHYIVKQTVTFNPNTSIYFTDYEVKPETVGQYTGLSDKNGKEIYEGDVLKDEENFSWEVVFKEGCFFVECTDLIATQLLIGVNFISEIIGNIYENPELLGDS